MGEAPAIHLHFGLSYRRVGLINKTINLGAAQTERVQAMTRKPPATHLHFGLFYQRAGVNKQSRQSTQGATPENSHKTTVVGLLL